MKSEADDMVPFFSRVDRLQLSGKNLAGLICDFAEKGKTVQFTAKGNSMFPFVKDGDVITVSPCMNKKPEPGDVVAFSNSTTNKLVVHRILKISDAEFESKGDGCFRTDGIQPSEKIIGIVSKVNQGGIKTYCLGPANIRKCITFFSRFGIFAIMSILFYKSKHYTTKAF